MELGVSALTRRERLERIASAERDRRSGRVELAIAVLGEGTEWPARVVLALAKLGEGEVEETRAILERSLDDWAAESGLDPLDVSVEAASSDPEIEEGDLDSPIDHDELERAFAQAEAQTDEMLDVNTVAARVLSDESADLAQLSGDELVPVEDPFALPERAIAAEFDIAPEEAIDAPLADSGVSGFEPILSTGMETDAAWADSPGWLESAPVEEFSGEQIEVHEEGVEHVDASDIASDIADGIADDENVSGGVILATLERWLVNLEGSRAGRAQ